MRRERERKENRISFIGEKVGPARSARKESQTLQLKSSYPARSSRPDLEKATEVMPQMMLSWE